MTGHGSERRRARHGRSRSHSSLSSEADEPRDRRRSRMQSDRYAREEEQEEAEDEERVERRRRSRDESREREHTRRRRRDDSRDAISRTRRRSRSPPRPPSQDRRSSYQQRRRRRSSSPRRARSPKRRRTSSRSPISRRPRLSSASPPPRRLRSPSPSRPKHTSSHRHHHHRRRHHRSRSDSRSPPPPHEAPSIRHPQPLPSQTTTFSALTNPNPPSSPDKQLPNLHPTGLLAATTLTHTSGAILKYSEPPSSRLPPPSQPWRLYTFKAASLLSTLPLSTRTCWLIGRDARVVDLLAEHPSISAQHAVLQFRYVDKPKNSVEGGEVGRESKAGVKLYIIDLESANGTFLNGDRIEERRYVQLLDGDMVTLGQSQREYVIMLPPKDGAAKKT